jgi:hypothetical protein
MVASSCRASVVGFLYSASAPGYQVEDERDYSKNQQDVNKPTQRVRGHQAQKPQNQQDHKNCPKH